MSSELDLGSIPIVLHSQGNLHKYQHNTMSDFFCKLTDPLNILGSWTMAMNSFDYNTAIINVDDREEKDESIKSMREGLNPSIVNFSLTPWLHDFNKVWQGRPVTFLFVILV